ncbi:hypothetical protein [Nitriliruptor alkaliphilus]|uniref:hypothetical protein n=1 Tax=Nitriliruptor alkaliphilus TaxID=427918 RepID=UPI0012EE2074|nr:hypothetical protein [Nitriliruptor alkaliphilus]
MAERSRRTGPPARGTHPAPRSEPTEDTGQHRLGELQRSAGNQAVASLLQVQREGQGAPGLLSMRPQVADAPGTLLPRLTPQQVADLVAEEEARQRRLRPLVTRWLDGQRGWILEQGRQGALSMPELVVRIREEVEGAREVPPVFLERVARQHLGGLAPPATRRTVTHAGVVAEIGAIISNVTSAKIQVGTDRTGLSVGISGTARGSVALGGGATAGVELTHKSVAVDLAFPFVGGSKGKAKGKIDKKGAWELAVSLPLAGREPIAAVPTAEAIGRSVREAEEAARGIVSLLHAGEEPDQAAIEELLGRVGAAFKDIQKVAAVAPSSGPQLTLELGVQGGEREVPTAGDPVSLPEVRGSINIVLRF